MVILDSAIVVVALPSIDADLGFSAGDLQWVLSAYLLSFGGLLLLGGRAADLLGRRRVFMVGTALFALASLACGLAGSATALIAARVVQGVAAAIMTPTALSIVTTTFEEGAERNKALGIWAAIGGIGATAAWLVGGPITDGLGWEWIFFINVPVAVAVVALSPVLLRESRDREHGRRFDVAGAVTITAALVALVYAVVEAPDAGWASGQTLGLLAISAVLIAALRRDRGALRGPARAAAPVPLALARRRQPDAVRARHARLRDAVHPHAVRAGRAQLLGARVRPRLGRHAGDGGGRVDHRAGDRHQGGLRTIATVGLALTGVGCLLLAYVSVDGSYFGDIFFGLLVFGPGLGAAYVAGSIGSLAGVAETDAGLASGLNNSSFQIGGAVGVAILSTVAVSHAAARSSSPRSPTASSSPSRPRSSSPSSECWSRSPCSASSGSRHGPPLGPPGCHRGVRDRPFRRRLEDDPAPVPRR